MKFGITILGYHESEKHPIKIPDLPDRIEAVGDDEDLEVSLRSGGNVVAGGLVQELRESTRIRRFLKFLYMVFY